MTERELITRQHRPRGVWMPAEDAPLYLANGWRLLDDGPGTGELLLQPPAHFQECAA